MIDSITKYLHIDKVLRTDAPYTFLSTGGFILLIISILPPYSSYSHIIVTIGGIIFIIGTSWWILEYRKKSKPPLDDSKTLLTNFVLDAIKDDPKLKEEVKNALKDDDRMDKRKSAEVLYRVGDKEFEKNEKEGYENAIRYYNNAIEIYPDCRYALFKLGECWEKLSEKCSKKDRERYQKQAIRYFKRTAKISLSPNSSNS